MAIPAIILGRGDTALGAMRCLARQGKTVLTATVASDLATKSRYFHPAFSRDDRRLDAGWNEDSYDILSEMSVDRGVLVPCSDAAATWVAEMPDKLRERFPSSSPSKQCLDIVQDKRNFADLCIQLDVPHPGYFLIESDEDLAAAPIEDLSNWFFKPSNSREFLAKYRKKAIRFTGRAEAKALWDKFSADKITVFMQEYVPGGADQHYFIDGFRDRHGNVRARLARRRTRIYPPDFGNSSYCYQIPIEDIDPAWQSLERILDKTEYRGIFSAEFKYDAQRDEYRILELNARAWVYVEFAAWCGIDVCNLAYLDALEQDVPLLVDKRPGAGCVNMYRDYHAIMGCPKSDRPSVYAIARQWIAARKTLFCWDDPMPALVWGFRLLVARLKRQH